MKVLSRLRTAALALLLGLGAVTGVASPAAAADVGYVGPSFTGTSAPTGQKPQSKLWYSGGSWWGVLFSAAKGDFLIHRLDKATQTWVDTGVLVDERTNVYVDALWDGSKLYVASAGTSATNTAHSVRINRFSFSGGVWTRDAGYPVSPISGGMEAVVLDRDTTGTLWITYTRSSSVWVTHSQASDTAWVAPYVVPVPGAAAVTADDISSIVAFSGKIGVLWGNQNENAYYFAVHPDGAGDSSWTQETAYSRPEGADDHMNVKAIQNDPQGRLFAIVKTSLNAAGDPLNVLLVRKPDGTWDTDNVVGTAGDNETRAILVIDAEKNEVWTFSAAPCCSGGIIYTKKASVSALLSGNPFPGGLGTPFIASSTNTTLNNPTSTKQTVNSTTDLVVLAGDDGTKRYMHNVAGLAPTDTTAPETTIESAPSGTVTSDAATVTFSSNEAGVTFACSLDGAAFAGCTSPTQLTGLTSGDHTFAVRATDPAGNTDQTPASASWTVAGVVDTVITSGPSGTVPDTTAQVSFTSSSPSPTFTCRLDGGTAAPCTSPVTYTGLAEGSHTVEVAATSGGVTDPTPATRTWTVDLTPVATFVPEADATVASATPTTNFGLTALESDTSPQKEALVRFGVSGVSGSVTKATVRLWSTNGSANSPKVFPTATGWGETTVTWSTKPTVTGAAIADLASTGTSTWVEYDVTSAVTGNGTYSFSFVPDSSDGVAWTSRESATAPQLVVESGPADTSPPETTITAGPGATSSTATSFSFASSKNGSTFECRLDGAAFAPCSSPNALSGLSVGSHTFEVRAVGSGGLADPTPASRTWSVVAVTTVTSVATHDTYADAANPTRNFGTATSLTSDGSPVMEGYVGFDLAGVSGTVTSAVLRLWVTNASVDAPPVRRVTGAWTESTLTYAARPAVAPAVVADRGAVSVGTWVEYDVTSAVTGNGFVSFALVATSSDAMVVSSSEATTVANRPQLVVTSG